jgi:uncharacterized protein YxjI
MKDNRAGGSTDPGRTAKANRLDATTQHSEDDRRQSSDPWISWEVRETRREPTNIMSPSPRFSDQGPVPEGKTPTMTSMPELYQVDQFQARRKLFTFLGAEFHLRAMDGRLLAFSKQKAFTLKEDIRVFADEAQTTELLRIKADRIIDFSASYQVYDALTNECYGSLRRKGWSSLFRDSWEILDADGVVRGRVREDSGLKAFLRRFNEMLAMFMPQTFHVEVDGRNVATVAGRFHWFTQSYDVDLSEDADSIMPRPLTIAMVILLLAIEGKQA